MPERMPTLYIPHGGGPCFFMEWTLGPPDTWNRMGDWLGGLGASLGVKPKAIMVVSAHWEEAQFTVTTAAAPPLIYDYFGFPEHTYHIRYPAPGAPALAARVRDLLGRAGIKSQADPERGFDHGVFIPFKLIYPDADIPVIQLSLKRDLDPKAHLAAGRALAALRDEGVLIVGSGMSYHNIGAFMRGREATGAIPFDAWLTDAATAPDAETRNTALTRWSTAPGARDAHPREDHLIPLMIAAGAAGYDAGHRIFGDTVMGAAVSAYRFG
jgi:aromatic ring-opening dioxygenase catalytic subunit (LigB family)